MSTVPTKRVDLWQPYMNLPQGGKVMAECELSSSVRPPYSPALTRCFFPRFASLRSRSPARRHLDRWYRWYAMQDHDPPRKGLGCQRAQRVEL